MGEGWTEGKVPPAGAAQPAGPEFTPPRGAFLIRMCKPIKNGVTNYALVFSKSAYLYNWRWHLGKGTTVGTPRGQPN